MRQTKLLFLIPIIIFAAIIIGFVPYMNDQKEIKQYAFELDSAKGKVKLSDFKGKIPLIYFGYMYCPDICPTSLSLTATALNKLPKEKADLFQLIFVSVDPDRDKPKELAEYAQFFYPSAIGLTSDENYIKTLTGNYGTFYAKEYLEGSKIEYSVAHTSFIYVMDKKGKLAHRIAHATSAEDIYSVLLKML